MSAAIAHPFAGKAKPVYLNFALKTFQSQAAYKFEYFVGVFNGLLYVFIFTSLWSAIYSGLANSSDTPFTRAGIITYAVFAMICRISMTMEDTEISARIRSGDIAMDMTKPVNFFIMNLSQTVGVTMFHWFTRVTPILLACFFAFDLEISLEPVRMAASACAWVMGYFVFFLLNFAFALLAFWFVETFSFQLTKYALINLFSGAIIPVDFFPSGLRPFMEMLPFQYIFYTPTAVFTGHLAWPETVRLMSLQAVWIVILGLACNIMWRSAQRKLVVQGG
jgi:ABC-2 type transport system permease protein